MCLVYGVQAIVYAQGKVIAPAPVEESPKKNETVVDEKEQKLLDFVARMKAQESLDISESHTALMDTPIFQALENEAGPDFAKKMLRLFDDIADAWPQAYTDYVRKSSRPDPNAFGNSFGNAVDAAYKKLSEKQRRLIDEAMEADAARQKEAAGGGYTITAKISGNHAFRRAMRSAFDAGFIRQPGQ